MRTHSLFGIPLGLAVLLACDGGPAAPAAEDNGEVPALYAHFSSAVTISRDGDDVVLESDGVPDHGSPYFNANDSRYEAYGGSNPAFALNPNRIMAQSASIRVPANPTEAVSKSATPLGAIGMAVNGVAIFNQYAGPNRPLTFEINTFDQYNGHPQQTGVYHYHVEPLHLTLQYGEDALLGVLLDGFALYGPFEGGRLLTNADLDTYHGHTSATADFPQGIYHYHVTAEDPYINGAGFFGVPGQASR